MHNLDDNNVTNDSVKAKGKHPEAHTFNKEDVGGDHSFLEGEESQSKRLVEGTAVGWAQTTRLLKKE